ncbi:MAG: helix-turn-helix transcriptional regulator [Phycisphaerae bacterium]|nr:helix-turn-helix transcriptional regulator [Phycisphaerae bacterium]
MAPHHDELDPVWKALANPDRRSILDLLREAELRGRAGTPTGELVMAFPGLSRFAVMQHLEVLQDANLVVARRDGRMVLNYLNAVPIRAIYERWVSRFEGQWAGALLSLKRRVESRVPSRSSAAAPRGKEHSRG